jgi:hypothetical protein
MPAKFSRRFPTNVAYPERKRVVSWLPLTGHDAPPPKACSARRATIAGVVCVATCGD